MLGILRGLQYLHDDKNLVHRDLKPQNILIMDYDDLTKVKLIDFGLAANFDGIICDFKACGTLLYMPPELINNNFAYTKETDIWAAGIILYEILTNSNPFYEKGESSSMIKARLATFRNFEFKQKTKISE